MSEFTEVKAVTTEDIEDLLKVSGEPVDLDKCVVLSIKVEACRNGRIESTIVTSPKLQPES